MFTLRSTVTLRNFIRLGVFSLIPEKWVFDAPTIDTDLG